MPGMSDQPIQFSPGGLPETVLPPAPAEAREGLEAALALEGEARRDAISSVTSVRSLLRFGSPVSASVSARRRS